MKKHLSLAFVAAMALGSMSYTASWADDTTATPPATQPAGQQVSDTTATDIHALIARLTNAALTPRGFSDLSQYLQTSTASASPNNAVGTPGQQPVSPVNQPRATAGGSPNGVASLPAFKNYDDIDAAVNQLNKDWKDKYNTDFHLGMDNEAAVYNGSFQIYRGDMSDTAQTAGARENPNGTPAEDQNAAPQIATVCITPQSGTPAANQEMRVLVSNRNDMPSVWRIVVPAGTDEQAVHDSLLKELNTLHDQRANWPSDQNDAYRAISRHVLEAFTNLNANPTTPAAPAGQQQ